ncbi:acyltransferase [Fimbriiglobus ruber]|uniref:Putative O-acetyltransferase n=1 Tax=Fimbriiglobus ruber TaxID=1908690 RepID=A0A225DZJ8_9BACT|nr:acyltransferase [Fimbriiglobus ruber]OWK43958.1 putative O-acetyltransferase [Fimbriiglobus ruber]
MSGLGLGNTTNVFTRDELLELGVAGVGREVFVDRSVRFFRPESVRFADRVRVDCFCVISAGRDGIVIGNNVHIAAGCFLFGGGGAVVLEDFVGLSSRVSLYTSTDDYVAGHLTNPTVPDEYRDVTTGPIVLRRHAIVGCGSVVLPGVTLGFGASVGALTVARKDVGDCEIVFGNPARSLPTRRNADKLREFEARYGQTVGQNET